MKKCRALIPSLSALVLVICVAVTLFAREYQREQASRTLLLAIEANDTNRALKALNAHADPDVRDREEKPLSFRPYLSRLWEHMRGIHAPETQAGSAALTLAVQHNNTIVAEALMARGARDVDKSETRDTGDEEFAWDRMGRLSVSLLVVAVQHKNVSLVRALIEQGTDVNCLDANHKTPLFYADDTATAEALIACGAHIDVMDKFGFTALDYRLDINKAVLNFAVAGVLLKHGAYDAKALPLAAHGAQDIEVLKRLLGSGRNVDAPDQDGSTPLILALTPLGITRFPLSWELPGKPEEWNKLQKARAEMQAQAVLLLMRTGANVNFRDKNGDTPLLLAAEGGRYSSLYSAYPGITTSLLEGARVDAQWPVVIKALLTHGARIDMRRNDGATPLMVAASHLQLPLVQLLLQQGAQVNLRTKKGATALSIVRHRSYAENDQRVRSEVIRLLKSAGATE